MNRSPGSQLTTTCISTTQGFRKSHQDRSHVGETRVWGSPALVLTLADGMGGLKDGETAAELAIKTVEAFSAEAIPRLTEGKSPRPLLRRLFAEANRSIWDFSRTSRVGSMGTTLLVVLAWQGQYLVAHVGDTRCYEIAGVGIRQLTRDHSVAEELFASGKLRPASPESSVYRHQLTRSLGEELCPAVDFYPRWRGYGTVQPDSVLLLCSDGLHGHVTTADLWRLLAASPDLGEACSALVLEALKNGSTDNITVVAALGLTP